MESSLCATRRTKNSLILLHDQGACSSVYGSPTAFLSDGERDEAMVFGSDRFEQLAHHFSLPYFGPDPARARL